MPDNAPPPPEIQGRLHEVARLLRESHSVDPAQRQMLAELVDELGRALRESPAPPEAVAQLAGTTAQLAEALQRRRDTGWLEAARQRFDEAALEAEAHAPVAVGLARRLIDALANIGI